MILGILQFELIIHDAESLKDKRRVVQSVKDRLHREHLVSVAEVGSLGSLNLATLGLAFVSNDGRRVGEVLDQITTKLRALHDAELGDVTREVLSGRGGFGVTATLQGFTPESSEALEQELLSRAQPSNRDDLSRDSERACSPESRPQNSR